MIDQITTSLAGAAAHLRQTGRPLVTLSYAQSLDGSIAAEPGRRLPLSGPAALRLTHELRASHDAILVGIGTVLADDPRLTVRLVDGAHPQPVVVDSQLRCPRAAKLLCNPPRPPWIATTHAAAALHGPELAASGARLLCLPTDRSGRIDLAALLARLGQLGIASLMVEGGARIITSFLVGRLADQVALTVVPRLIGGQHAVGDLGAPPELLPRLRQVTYHACGDDLIVHGALDWGTA